MLQTWKKSQGVYHWSIGRAPSPFSVPKAEIFLGERSESAHEPAYLILFNCSGELSGVSPIQNKPGCRSRLASLTRETRRGSFRNAALTLLSFGVINCVSLFCDSSCCVSQANIYTS